MRRGATADSTVSAALASREAGARSPPALLAAGEGPILQLSAPLPPALGRARAQATTVYGASTLRQLCRPMQIYATTYNQYVMPAKIATGSDAQNMWCGINVLGPLFGVKSRDQGIAVNRISKMLN